MRSLAVIAAGFVVGTALAGPAVPLPRVFATYCSWQGGGYRFRDAHVPLFATLGWAYDQRENTQVTALLADLERYDLFVPPSLYNYDNAQPYEQHLEAWRAFLERGGVLLALDANYGQMIGWVTRLGEGLELQTAQCPEGMKGQPPVRLVAADDPAAPPASCKTPWAHFTSIGKGWTVLATCPEGNPICVRASLGKGVLIATNLYDDAGFPSAEYVARLWQMQWPTLMDRELAVDLDRGPAGVGRKLLRLRLPAGAADSVLCEQRAGDGSWQSQTVAIPADGQEIALPLAVTSGRHDVRLELRRNGVRRWWSSWAETPADVPAQAAALQAQLQTVAGALARLPESHPLRVAAQRVQDRLAATTEEAQRLLGTEAGPETDRRWQGLAAELAATGLELRTLSGRATVAARGAVDAPFAVVRSAPLVKVFRDQAPDGPVEGEVRITAARGEGESAQVVIVPLRADLQGVQVRLEPFVDSAGQRLSLDTELHRVGYAHTSAPSTGAEPGRDWWPDPLLPAGLPFAVTQVSQPLWLDLWTPLEATAGRYRGALVVEAAGRVERVPVTLDILDFTLPRAHSLRQVFAFRAPQITQRYSGQADYKTATPVETYLRMLDVCLKRRVGVQAFGWEGSPDPVSGLAYLGETLTPAGWTFDFSQVDRIWQRQFDSGMRTLFVGFTPGCGSASPMVTKEPYWVFLDAYLAALVPHLREKGWFEAAVWYMVDECWQEDAVQANLRLAGVLDRLAPGLKRLMTAPRDARLYGKSHIWVPGGLPEASPNEAANQALLTGWAPSNPERWWYICCGPTHPYPNFFVDYPTIDPRQVFWLTWKYNKTGFLYWGVEYFGDPREMTADGPTEKYTLGPANMGNGDGTLCYWGPQQEFYPSVRLNAIRDGIEDYEYFALARRLADAAERLGKVPALVASARTLLAVDERVIKATDGSPNFTYTLNPADLLEARRNLAECILALQVAGVQAEAP
jgi:hypothetical protein